MCIHGDHLREVAEMQASRVLSADGGDDEEDEEDEDEERRHNEEEEDEEEEEETVWTIPQSVNARPWNELHREVKS